MIFSSPLTNDLNGLSAWARRLIDELNRFGDPLANLPVFADDAAAETGRIKVGEHYVTPEGLVRRRMA